MTLELIWRGWSHSSMFLAGGTCFLLLGKLSSVRLNSTVKAIMGAAVITGVELAAKVIRECRPYCQGLHIMALGWEAKVPELIKLAGL